MIIAKTWCGILDCFVIVVSACSLKPTYSAHFCIFFTVFVEPSFSEIVNTFAGLLAANEESKSMQHDFPRSHCPVVTGHSVEH